MLIAEIKSNRKALPAVLLSHFLPLPPTRSFSLPLTSLSSFEQLFFCCPLGPLTHLSLYFHYFFLFIHLPLSLRWSKAEQEFAATFNFPRKSAAGDGKGVRWCSSRSSAVVPVEEAEREDLWRERAQVKKKVLCTVGKDRPWVTAQFAASVL